MIDPIYTALDVQIRRRNFEKMHIFAQKWPFFRNREISKWPISGRVTQNDKKNFLAGQNILVYAHVKFFCHTMYSSGDRTPKDPPPSKMAKNAEGGGSGNYVPI